jgi:hypothetical protein
MSIRASVVVAALLIVLSPPTFAVDLPDATADYESLRDGASPAHGKVYVSKGRVRSEAVTSAATIAVIVDPTTKKLSILMPPPVGCITQPLTDSVALNTPLLPSKNAKEEVVGSEMVAGHPTKKYRISTTIDGTTRVQYLWRATDLKGFPVQTADENGKIRSTFKNVKLGKPDAKLFAMPAACKPLKTVRPAVK